MFYMSNNIINFYSRLDEKKKMSNFNSLKHGKIIIYIMIENKDHDWGEIAYPVVK
jgi:hypothetical protein